ncbi:hypothetical protein RMCC_5100 [Mycolicibacterium canariasense]|uniref:DUF2273 domain-containing protein n=1 Tax=Mycolicibacterium canariasense TaxID=228230 RepID=A0A124E2W7_MYCCR|nr:hypothetical protein [Mycolicibacterium canariasense]MCV7212995.1 DUF2273 domain-containing protein [Mycolicibacterium canariasense]ORV10209.1 hypothetical protein AWB94_07785 [Mycolicibacterium canariasense]GAS98135.1 hypothetical protein RMCC_5100 [Mycolicibacterium canariasense]
MNGKYLPTVLFAGLLLALAAVTGGLGGFLLALVLGAACAAVGAHLDGAIDLTALGRQRG